jgi:hypothetical protein
MQKLILMSVVFFPFIFSIGASRGSNARLGLKRAVLVSFIFTVLWVLLAPYLVSAK